MDLKIHLTITALVTSRYPQTSDRIPEIFAASIARTRNHPFYISCEQSSSQTLEREKTRQFTNLLYNKYRTPLYTIETACCKMPSNVAGVWRNNLEKILNFLDLMKTGVQFYVKAIGGQPLRNATIQVVGSDQSHRVTKNLGHFRIILPSGPKQLVIHCAGYEARTLSVMLSEGVVTNLGDVVLPAASGQREQVIAEGKVVPLNAAATGTVTGFVLDTSSRPVEKAKVVAKNLKGQVINETTADSLGTFTFANLPVGDVKLWATASGMVEASSSVVHVTALGVSKGNMFHLESDEHVWGMPRLLFVLAMGCLLVGAVACFAFCVTTYQAKQGFSNYSFSMLPNKERERPLFEEDDDDEEDMEVYRAPIKSEYYTVNWTSSSCE